MGQVDWADLMKRAGNASFEPLPPNDYEVEIEKAEAKTAQSSGKLMFVVTFKVTEGPHANRKVFNNFVVSPESEGAMGYFFRHMKALGLNSDFFANQPTSETIANALVGRRARVEVGQRVWNGETRNEVKNIKPSTASASGGTTPPPPPPPPAEESQSSAPAPQAEEKATAGPPAMPF